MRFEPLTTDHFPYAWAAYKKGAFAEAFEKDLNARDFDAAFAEMVAVFLSRPLSEMMTVFANTKDGNIPVAVITVEYAQRLALPHAYWFPWSTPRNRLETGVLFFKELKKNSLVLVTAREGRDVKFFQHLCKYGLMRAVGKIWDYYAEGDGAMVFQSVGS